MGDMGFRLYLLDFRKHELQLSKGIEGLLDVGVFECGGDLDAKAGLAFGYDRIAEADNHDAELQQSLALGDRLRLVADHDWNDGGRRVVQLEAQFGETFTDAADVGV